MFASSSTGSSVNGASVAAASAETSAARAASEAATARAERRGVGKRKAVFFDERRERGSFVGGSRTRRRLLLWVVRDALKAEIHDPGRAERDPARASERGRDAGERRRDAGGEGALAVKRREEADARRARRRVPPTIRRARLLLG